MMTGDPRTGESVGYGKMIDNALTYLSENSRRKILREFRNHQGNQERLLHTRQELLAGVFIARQGYEAAYTPEIDNLTPDWHFSAPDGRRPFLGEVASFHINRPIELSQDQAMARAGRWSDWIPDNGHRLYHSILGKVGKYKDLVSQRDLPLVVFVYSLIGAGLAAKEVTDCLYSNDGLFSLYPALTGVFHFHDPSGDLHFVLSVARSGGGHEFDYYPNPYAAVKGFVLNSDFLPNNLPPRG